MTAPVVGPWTRSSASARLRDAAKLGRVLMGGTPAIRQERGLYLPKFEMEEDDAYERRLLRTFLFDGFKAGVKTNAGRIFARPIVPGDDVAPVLLEHAESVDLRRHLNVFCRDVLEDGLAGCGLSLVLVDMQGEDAGDKRRPYWSMIPFENVLRWRTRVVGGVEQLAWISIEERGLEPEGAWGEQEVKRCRVLFPGGWETFRELRPDVWASESRGEMRLKNGDPWPVVPIAPFYAGGELGFFDSEPPLGGLREKNLEHYQSSSEQRVALSYARRAVLCMAGVKGQGGGLQGLGSSIVIELSDPQGSAKWVEQSGQAVKVGQDDLERLKHEMSVLAMMPLAARPGTQRTAEETRITTDQQNCGLASIATALQDCVETAWTLHAAWIGEKKGGGSWSVNHDFVAGIADPVSSTALLEMAKAGKLSDETLWREMKRRGVLGDDFNAEEEAEALVEQRADAMKSAQAFVGLGADTPEPEKDAGGEAEPLPGDAEDAEGDQVAA